MIVLKATQEKVLSVLQSVAGIVERRHTLPILANVLLRKSGVIDSGQKNSPVANCLIFFHQLLAPVPSRRGSGLAFLSARSTGFFSASKANLRNAP